MGFEASQILVQIPALPLTYSVIVNEFLPVFQCPVKRGEKSLSSRFVMSVTKVAHVGYPAQGPTHNVTSHRQVLPLPLLEARRCMRQHHQATRRHSTIKGCELSLFPPPHHYLPFISVTVASEGENWLEILSQTRKAVWDSTNASLESPCQEALTLIS